MILKKFFLPLWITGSLFLFLYSYTQVDLSLTLSRASIFQTVEKYFQYIGWFNRPVSSYLYIAIFLLLFVLYLFTLWFVKKNQLPQKTVWITITIITIILFFAYNAFSYDLFNYIFDAKILTHYHQNPYIHKALDFPGDPMLSFMHWTHRTYPYGPLWLGLTIPLSFLGGNIFLLTFFLFKGMMAVSFFLSAKFIYKVSKLIDIKNPLFPVVFFAFNPLVLSESLVSAHNDIVMLFLSIVSLYLLLKNKKAASFILLIVSIAIKFSTAFLLPVYIYFLANVKKGKLRFGTNLILVTTLLMVSPVILATYRTNFQPWYLLNFLIFASFGIKKSYILIPCIIVSLFGVLNYLPFIYLGVYDVLTTRLMDLINISSLIFGILSFILFFAYEELFSKKKSV